MLMKMPKILKVKMTMMVISITDLAVLFCSSVMYGNGGNVKTCFSGVVHGWAAASLL